MASSSLIDIGVKTKIASYPNLKINRSVFEFIQGLLDTQKSNVRIDANSLMIIFNETEYTITFSEKENIKKIVIKSVTTKRNKQQITKKEYLFEGDMIVVLNTKLEAYKPLMDKTPSVKANQVVTTYVNDQELSSPIHTRNIDIYYDSTHSPQKPKLAITSTNMLIKKDGFAIAESKLHSEAYADVSATTCHYSLENASCTPGVFPSREHQSHLATLEYDKIMDEWLEENTGVEEDYKLAKYIFGDYSRVQCKKEFDAYSNRLKNFKGSFKNLSI